MNIEIEKKFTVDRALWETISKPEPLRCKQTYLTNDPEKVVRVRAMGSDGFITIKGKQKGISRAEFEYEIPVAEATKMIDMFGEQQIDKYRYKIQLGKHLWEIDEFLGDNEGLIVAEVELQSEDEAVELPEWVDQDVSTDLKYMNNNLQQHPFKSW